VNGWVFISSPRFTVLVLVKDGRIKDGPPIVRARWVGRDVDSLIDAWRADQVISL
jgi:hypothetical protein